MNKTTNIIFLVINLVLLVALIVALLFTLLVPRKAEEPVPEVKPFQSAEDAAEVMGAGEAADAEELDAWIANMKELAQKHNVDAYFLQELFPEQIVYKHRGSIYYDEVDTTLKMHDYDWANLQEDENGVLNYVEEGGRTGIVGIDVSKYQGDIDWQKVKDAGVQFAILRVGYRGYGSGEIMLDERFEEYIAGATAAEIPIGVYFFSQAINTEEAVEEAEFVLNAISGYTLAWPVVFDMEEITEGESRTQNLTAAEITDIALAFCQRVQQAGHKPMVYGNVSWFLALMEPSRLQDMDLWFAQYRPMPYYPYHFTMWQYTPRGRINGIAGDVDLNISFVDYNAEVSG